jgi:nitrate reductase delta subunit
MKHSFPLRALARLVEYPEQELVNHISEIDDVINKNGVFNKSITSGLLNLTKLIRASDLLELQEQYVDCFDRGRQTSLHLFEHVHGDSRERGQAMVDLLDTYKQTGYLLDGKELPDHLVVVLEFASTLDEKIAKSFLSEMTHIFDALYTGLAKRNSLYAWIVAAAIDFSGEKVKLVELKPVETTMDEEWEEPAAFGGCSTKGQGKPDEAQPVHFVKKVITEGARA